MIKGWINQEDITILNTVNVYTPSNRASKYVKQKRIGLKGEIEKSTIIVQDFNTS